MSLLIKNAKIATMNRDCPRASAAVTDGEYFAYVGDEAGALDYLKAHPQAGLETVDAGGRLLLPGFNDSHMHYLHYVKAKLSVDLVGTGSIAELLERMKAGLAGYKPETGLWLMGEGWNQDFFTDEKRFPTAADLDKITTEYPILIMRACFHIGVLNTKAMELLGIDKESVGAYGAFAETNPDGTPNGVVKEHVFDDLKSKLPAPGIEELVNMMCLYQNDLFEYGITSVQSDDFLYVPEGRVYEMMDRLRDAGMDGRLKLRFAEQAVLADPKAIGEFFEKGYDDQFGNRRFKIAAVKLLADGSLGARTALMRKPYADDASTKGLPIYETQEALDQQVLTAHRRNMGAIIHAIGDGAVEMCLDAIQRARQAMPHLTPRHGIVHCQITDKDQIIRFKELDVVAYTQPIFIDYDMHIVYDRVGKELGDTSYAWRDYHRLGVHQAFGTDCPVESFKPLPGIYCAVTRKDLKGRGPYLPQQALAVEDALWYYTAGGAYCSGEESVKGQIRSGMLADFVLMDKDLLTIPAEELLTTQVERTYIGGQLVYSK